MIDDGAGDAVEMILNNTRVSENVEGVHNYRAESIRHELSIIRYRHPVFREESPYPFTFAVHEPEWLGIRKHRSDCDLENAKGSANLAWICPINLIDVPLEASLALASNGWGIFCYSWKIFVLPHLIDLAECCVAHEIPDRVRGAIAQENPFSHAQSLRMVGEATNSSRRPHLVTDARSTDRPKAFD